MSEIFPKRKPHKNCVGWQFVCVYTKHMLLWSCIIIKIKSFRKNRTQSLAAYFFTNSLITIPFLHLQIRQISRFFFGFKIHHNYYWKNLQWILSQTNCHVSAFETYIMKTGLCYMYVLWFFMALKIMIFRWKIVIFFLIFAQNLDREYTLELPH